MEIKIDIPSDVFAETLKSLLTDKQILREATTRAITQSNLVDQLSRAIQAAMMPSIEEMLSAPETEAAFKSIVLDFAKQVIVTKTAEKVSNQLRKIR